MGKSIAFWDGDELVIWTKNLHPNMRGHGEAEYSDRMEMVERYYKTGNSIVVDVTRYDPAAYAAPQHTVGVFARAMSAQTAIKAGTAAPAPSIMDLAPRR
jgi:hypothetical protein